jgi:hypothetical protein
VAKRIIRKIVIFFGIVAIFPAIYSTFEGSDLYYDLYGNSDFSANAVSWLDSNGDGIQNLNESPLADVCIWYVFHPEEFYTEDLHWWCDRKNVSVTDTEGKWKEFIAWKFSCKELWVFAKAPSGLKPTTPLASHGCSANFGFAPEKVQIEKNFPSAVELIRRYSFLILLRNIFIGVFIIGAGILGTMWLDKEQKSDP